MVDRVTLPQPVYLKVWYGGSTIDVPSASALSPSQITNVLLGTGTLLNGQHAQPVSNFRIKE
jgi:hypothetical protein